MPSSPITAMVDEIVGRIPDVVRRPNLITEGGGDSLRDAERGPIVRGDQGMGL